MKIPRTYRISEEVDGAIKANAADMNISEAEVISQAVTQRRLYVMKNQRNGLCKIGMSRNPLKREETLQSEEPEVELLFSIQADDRAERALHQFFSDKRVRGEWFKLTEEDISKVSELVANFLDELRRAPIGMRRVGMTARRQEALDFIRANQRIVTVGPTIRQLAEHLDVAGNAAQNFVEGLRKLGEVLPNDGNGLVLAGKPLSAVPSTKEGSGEGRVEFTVPDLAQARAAGTPIPRPGEKKRKK